MYLTKPNNHGGDVYGSEPLIDFSASLNPLGMPEAVRRALIASVDGCIHYPDPYCRALRDAIGRAEGVPVEHILCGAGASELLYQYAAALPEKKPGLIVAPAFSEYAAALQAAGHGVEVFTLKAQNGFRLTCNILSLDLSKYAAVFVCSPANPTGITVEPEVLEGIAKAGVRLLLDLSFLGLTARPALYDVPALLARFPHAAVLRSPTKSFAIPGVRLGYLLCADTALTERMTELTQCWNVSVPAQAAGAAAMACGDFLRRSAEIIGAERERLSREYAALGLAVVPGEANFLLLYAEKELAIPLAKRGYAIRDCADFVGLGRGYYRVAVRTRAENDRLLGAVREVLG